MSKFRILSCAAARFRHPTAGVLRYEDKLSRDRSGSKFDGEQYPSTARAPVLLQERKRRKQIDTSPATFAEQKSEGMFLQWAYRDARISVR